MELTKEKHAQLIGACQEADAEYAAACAKFEKDPAVQERRTFDSKIKKFCEEFAESYDDAYGYEYVHSFEFKGERLHWVLTREDQYRYLSVPSTCLALTCKEIHKHDWDIERHSKNPGLKQLEALTKQRTATEKAIEAVTNLKVEAPGPLVSLLEEQNTQIAILKNDLARIAATMWLHIKERDR